ncbi:MAG: hypothetical protein ACFFD6_08810 [Candidatus Thorarchaeota archaeon]
MSESPVTYNSSWGFISAFLLGLAINIIIGIMIPSLFQPGDWLQIIVLFFAVPCLTLMFAYFIGWFAKKRIVEYNPPKWHFESVQFKLNDVPEMLREYHRTFWRLEARSNYWIYHLPIFMVVILLGFPIYVSQIDPGALNLLPFLYPLGLIFNHCLASVGAFFATSNSASEDFALPLIREALWLGKEQSKTKGISQVRLVMDKAEEGGLRVYRDPRIIMRIKGFEQDAYIESWSEDLRAITRMLCRLYEGENHGQVVWWWVARDRNFRKYAEPDDKGYYVKLPVKSQFKELGVRDVRLVTDNGIAILLLEIARLRGKSDALTSLLSQLGIDSDHNAQT